MVHVLMIFTCLSVNNMGFFFLPNTKTQGRHQKRSNYFPLPAGLNPPGARRPVEGANTGTGSSRLYNEIRVENRAYSVLEAGSGLYLPIHPGSWSFGVSAPGSLTVPQLLVRCSNVPKRRSGGETVRLQRMVVAPEKRYASERDAAVAAAAVVGGPTGVVSVCRIVL
ncbi:hypothetical protein B0F90DRAFT_494410 [Multifurca ochricompacta]|uniref:Uncharacterized protein n=1 Tax=Multifurca ochricompacta TaxID=376703 RepID=A0AAD4MAP7_9AGAM|nr:hypothetical protein B0F90DRAFT_494410 [Multifurca ochricompacta]